MSARGAFALAVGAALALSACVAIPTDGAVQQGDAGVDVPEPAFPIPGGGPEIDAPPAAIVAGFIEANAAGVAGDLSFAYDYLTPTAARDWAPYERVVVFGSGEVNDEWDAGSRVLRYTLPVAAYIDAEGRMTESAGTPQTLEFSLRRDASNQWRIAELPAGVVLSEANFQRIYRDVTIAFSTPDGQVAVGERRWLPQRFVETDAANALIGGPSPWLADAVVTGIPPATELEVESVPIEAGEAQVVLRGASFGTPAERGLITRQFAVTLEQLPDVNRVSVTQGAAAGSLGGDDTYLLEPAPVPGSRAIVFVGGRLGTWDGTDVRVFEDAAGALPDGASHPALNYDDSAVAFLAGGDVWVSVAAGGPTVAIDDAAEPEGTMESVPVVRGSNLVEPSFDRHGWLWTGETDNDGLLVGVLGDESRSLEVPWLTGRELVSVKVSRDGSRVAVLSRDAGVERLDLAGLVRDMDGKPLSVSAATLPAGTDLHRAVALTWVDDQTLAVLGASEPGEAPALHIVAIGGRTSTVLAVPDAIGIAARNGDSSIVVVTRTGALHVRTASGWSAVTVGSGDGTESAFTAIAYAG